MYTLQSSSFNGYSLIILYHICYVHGFNVLGGNYIVLSNTHATLASGHIEQTAESSLNQAKGQCTW